MLPESSFVVRLLQQRSIVMFVNAVLCALWILRARSVFPSLPARIPVHFGPEGVTWASPTLENWLALPHLAVSIILVMFVAGQFAASHPRVVNGLPEEWRGELPAEERAVLSRYIKAMSAQFSLILCIALFSVYLNVEFVARTAREAPDSAYTLPNANVLAMFIPMVILAIVPLMAFSSQMPRRARR